MKRKDFLKAGLLAAAATPLALSSCAEEVPTESSAGPNIISTKKHRWKNVYDLASKLFRFWER